MKLADFGLSKIIWDKDTLTPCGTVGYTAPEIVCDQKYSKGVDMWAIGCVLYTMLCGFPPFYDESISALTHKVARGHFAFLSPWWDPISEDAKDLIRGLLCVDPRKRYTVGQVLRHPWLAPKSTHSFDSSQSMRIQAMRNAAAASPHSSLGSSSPDQRPPHFLDLSSTTDLGSDTSSRRKDVFSPGMATLKEIFDITAAVQRMAEENTHYGDANGRDDDHMDPPSHAPLDTTSLKQQYNAQAAAHHQQRLAKITAAAAAPGSPTKNRTPAVMNTGTTKAPPGFDLNMNNATLLKNRRKQMVAPCQWSVWWCSPFSF